MTKQSERRRPRSRPTRRIVALVAGIVAFGTFPVSAEVAGAAESTPRQLSPTECFTYLPSNDAPVEIPGRSFDSEATSDGRFVVMTYEPFEFGSGFDRSRVERIDTTDGSRVRADVALNGGESDGAAWGAAISADGRYVSFLSDSTDLVDGDSNGVADAFVRDLETGATTLVSRGSNGASGVRSHWALTGSQFTDVSDDGSVVVFSSAVNLADQDVDEPWFMDVYAWDETSGTAGFVSSTPTYRGLAQNRNARISGDGRIIVFEWSTPFGSWAGRFDRDDGQLQMLDQDVSGTDGGSAPGISADGRFVAFPVGFNPPVLSVYDADTGARRTLTSSYYEIDRPGIITVTDDGSAAAHNSTYGYVVFGADAVGRLVLDEDGTSLAATYATREATLLDNGEEAVVVENTARANPYDIVLYRTRADRSGIDQLRPDDNWLLNVHRSQDRDIWVYGHNLRPGIFEWSGTGVDIELPQPTSVMTKAVLSAAPSAPLGTQSYEISSPSGCRTKGTVDVEVIEAATPTLTGVSELTLRPNTTYFVLLSGTNLYCPCSMDLGHGITVGPFESRSSDYSRLGVSITTPSFVDDLIIDVVSFSNGSGLSTTLDDAMVGHAVNGEFLPLRPTRILDTRSGVGGTQQPITPTARTVQVAGRGGVPADGRVSAVVMNVTAVTPSAGSYVTVWPSGTERPLASNLNFARGETVANQVTVPIGSDGSVDVFVATGSTELIFDVVGYYSSATGPAGGRFLPTVPTRLVDTRVGYPLGERQIGRLLFEPSPIAAVVLNVTIVNPSGYGYVSVVPAGEAPTTSSVNFVPGQTVPNLVVVGLGDLHGLDFFNAIGDTHLIVDVVGVYGDGTEYLGDSAYRPLQPTRFLDTRTGTGAAAGKVGNDDLLTLHVAGRHGMPDDAAGVAANFTVTEPTKESWLTVWPDGLDMPETSNLNYRAGRTVPNSVLMGLGATGGLAVANASGETHVIADISGWFTAVVLSPPDSSSLPAAAVRGAAATMTTSSYGWHEPVHTARCLRCELRPPEIEVSPLRIVP